MSITASYSRGVVKFVTEDGKRVVLDGQAADLFYEDFTSAFMRFEDTLSRSATHLADTFPENCHDISPKYIGG